MKFTEGITADEIDTLNAFYRVEILHSNEWSEYVLRAKEEATFNALELANIYYSDQRTIWAHPNFIADIEALTINDTHFNEQWYLHNTSSNPGTPDVDIDAYEAWDITTGTSNIVVAVIDNGVEAHEDLPSSRLVPGYDPTGQGSGAN